MALAPTNTLTTGIGALLPADARKHLIEAAKITDEHARNLAVEAAIRHAKVKYPQFFKEESPA